MTDTNNIGDHVALLAKVWPNVMFVDAYRPPTA